MATRSRPTPAAKPAPETAPKPSPPGASNGAPKVAGTAGAKRARAAGGNGSRATASDGTDVIPPIPTLAAHADSERDRLLQGAAEEAARLLDADGAFVYLVDPETGILHFTHSAGIADPEPGHWIRELQLPVGTGMFGKAVAERRMVVTQDYTADRSFSHAQGPDRFVDEVGLRSLVVAPLVAGMEVFGALGTFSRRPDAFSAPQIALVRSLAEHAAFAMANARLIAELDRSRQAGERQAVVERSLRELGTRISGARDPEAVVQFTIDEALRLLDGDGARIDIVDPEARLLKGLFSSGDEQILESEWPRDPDDTLEVGASGRAVVTGETYISRDYIEDPNLVHGHGPDTYVRSKGIHGVIATPLHGDQGPFGAITVWSTKVDAFGPDDAALLETIAGQSAVALGRARLIEELGRSREALARRAEEERTLREIGGRLATIGSDPGDLLLRIVHEAARLLGAERARLDLVEPVQGKVIWTYPEDSPFTDAPVLDSPEDEEPIGLAGLAVREGRPVATGDYMADRRFKHYKEGDEGVQQVNLHSVITAPVVGEDGLVGVFQAGHRDRDAFGEDALRLLDALAGQASVALANARLVDRLATSQGALERTADAERALREIARRMMTIQDPAELLQDVVDEAARLLGSSGAVIDLLDPATGEVHWAHDAGMDDATRSEWQALGVGGSGVHLAIRERRVVVTPEYAADERFPDGAPHREFFDRVGIRSIAFAPLIGEAVVLGTLAVFSGEVGRFGEQEGALLAALADLATIAIHNAELIRELGRSREETSRRAETERTLREIAARVTAIRDADAILGLIVDETRRVLASDGAHLTRISDDRTHLTPVVLAGGMDDETRSWLRTQQFPIDGGINGLAAGQGRVVWTPSYATDPRIPRDTADLETAERMGLGAMAAAPLRAPGGEVIGTLAVSYRQSGTIAPDRLATLQALADHAAIALSNSDLLERLEASEANYRGLVQTTPDVIWRNDAEGRFTFLADTAETLFGWTAKELTGQHFSFVMADEALEPADEAWARINDPDSPPLRLRFVVKRKDGTVFPTEVSAVGIFEDGVFVGAQGTVRDISDRERLEQVVRESEVRYRSLVQSSPDLIFEMDGRGVYTFYSDRTEDVIGWLPDELIGHSFTEFIDIAAFPQARERLAEIAANPGRPSTDRLLIRHKDGHKIPFEVSVVGQVDDAGQLVAIRGVARDISERERLELELRSSEERYRFLVENAPDIVFSADAQTRFLFISDTIERLTGFRPDEVVGQTFDRVVAPSSMHVASERWERVAANPTEPQVLRLELLRKDGGTVPVEIHSVAQLDASGDFAGVHGSARDIGERERLERELRESEVRYRYLVQSSPDLVWMTDDAGRLTFVSDQSGTILGWEPEELIGRSFSELAPPDERRGALARFRALRTRPHEVHRTRLKVQSRDGRELAMEITSIGMVQDGEFIGAHGAARDVSERDRLEQDIRRQAVELASSEERSHLARELHDSVTQALFSMTLLSRSIELLLVKDPAQVPGKLSSLRELQREALAEMRALIFELRPGNVEENGLIQALRTHSAALSGRIGLPVVVEGDLAVRPSLDCEEGLYRIAQEALHNVVKHAGAKQVRVEVGRVADGIHLRVIDDGRGFDPTAVPDGHLGLAGMQSRAERLGGTLTVASMRDRGTTIDVVIPDARPVEAAPA